MGRHLAQGVQELFEDCRRGQTQQVQSWIAQKGKKHKSPLNFLRPNNGAANGVASSGWLAGLREPSTSHTLLHLAALHGHCELACILLERDAQLVTARDRKGCLPLHLAAWNGHERLIGALLDAAPATVNAVNNAKESALHLATLNGHANVVRLLLKRHADARLRNARFETPLDIAVRIGKANLCRLLLFHCPELSLQSASDCCAGSPVSSKPVGPLYPLHSAARLGHTECVEALLEHGFDVEYLGPEGTALHAAARQGQTETMRELLRRGTNLNNRNSDGLTALGWLEGQLGRSGADPVMVKRWRECRRLIREAETQTPTEEGRRSRERDAWKSVMPEGREHRNGTLNSQRTNGISPVASPRSVSLAKSTVVSPNGIQHSTRSPSSPFRGAFSPTICTYQPLPTAGKTPSPGPTLPYSNVPDKPLMLYDNAPPPYCQKQWAHNCGNSGACTVPSGMYDRNHVSPSSAQNGHVGHGMDELGLARLPTEDALGAESDAFLSPCSTLERSPASTRAYNGGKPYTEGGGGAPLAAQEESVTPNALPATPERTIGSGIGKMPSPRNGDGMVPSCSSISTLAIITSSTSSCSLPMVSHLSPLSTPSAASTPRSPAERQRAATTIGEFNDHHSSPVENGGAPTRSPPSSSCSSQQPPPPPPPLPLHHPPPPLPSSSSSSAEVPPPPPPGVRHLVQWAETNHAPPTPTTTMSIQKNGGPPVGVVHARAASLPAERRVDHAAQWKEIDEMLSAIQRDPFLISRTATANGDRGDPEVVDKQQTQNSFPSSTSSSLDSPNTHNGTGTTPHQPIIRWLKASVGLASVRQPSEDLRQQQSTALQVADHLQRNGFDRVQFMKGALNTQLMGEMGIARPVQLQICRHLNDKSQPEQIRSADQFEFVSDWLDSLHLLDHLGSFAKANLTSTTDLMAANLSRSDLEKMGITQLGHIARIVRSLDLAAQNQRKKRPRPTKLSNSFSPSSHASANGSAKDSSSMSGSNKSQTRSIGSSRAATLSPALDMADLRARLTDGCVRFSAHYLGATEISNVEGTEYCRRAMNVAKARIGHSSDVPQLVLEVSVAGIDVRDSNTQLLLHNHPIGHIQVVCQDELDLNCFAYIFQQGERHFCHVFCVLTAIIAKEIIVTLGEAFNLAYQIALQQ